MVRQFRDKKFKLITKKDSNILDLQKDLEEKTGLTVSINNKKNVSRGIAYLGSRPTFKGKEIFLETNIFGIKKNLYKKKLRVYFLKFIRRDRKFRNSAALIKQMNKDVISSKKV